MEGGSVGMEGLGGNIMNFFFGLVEYKMCPRHPIQDVWKAGVRFKTGDQQRLGQGGRFENHVLGN